MIITPIPFWLPAPLSWLFFPPEISRSRRTLYAKTLNAPPRFPYANDSYGLGFSEWIQGRHQFFNRHSPPIG